MAIPARLPGCIEAAYTAVHFVYGESLASWSMCEQAAVNIAAFNAMPEGSDYLAKVLPAEDYMLVYEAAMRAAAKVMILREQMKKNEKNRIRRLLP